MRPEQEVPSGSPFAHFKESMRKILSVSKSELDQIRKQEAAEKKQHPVKTKAKRRSAA